MKFVYYAAGLILTYHAYGRFTGITEFSIEMLLLAVVFVSEFVYRFIKIAVNLLEKEK